MWKTLGKTALSVARTPLILKPESILQQQLRTTYILKRRFPPMLHKAGHGPKKLKSKHYVYDLIRNTDVEKQPEIDVILTSYVDGLGNIGDRVSVRPNYAYNKLLLPGLAVYPSPDNLEKFKNFQKKTDDVVYSTATAQRTLSCLSRMTLTVAMNKENPWTLKPWHIKASFRKCGYHVPEEAIELPEKPIKGPDMDLQNKEFFVTVTVNNTEKTQVRCIIHHWASDLIDRLPHTHEFWKERHGPVFPEHEDVLKSLPSCPKDEQKTEMH